MTDYCLWHARLGHHGPRVLQSFLYIDGRTKYLFFKPVRKLADQLTAFNEVASELKSLSGRDLRLFKCDGASYYTSHQMTEILRELGARRKLSAAYASQQNAVPEAWNEH